MNEQNITAVRSTLLKFQDGYSARQVSTLDEFMQLFVQDEGVRMIGIGATEWFEGPARIREIVEGDWRYWGDVRLDVAGAKITVHGDVAWLSTTGTVTQTEAFDTAIQFHLDDMKAMLSREDLSIDDRLMEATHYGLRRLRERAKGLGYRWAFTFTAVLIQDGAGWRFHTLHWAMPVD